MSGTLLQIIGVLAVIVIFATVLIRPAGIFAVILAVGVVIAAVVVSWRDVDQYRAQQRAALATTQQQDSAALAGSAALPSRP